MHAHKRATLTYIRIDIYICMHTALPFFTIVLVDIFRKTQAGYIVSHSVSSLTHSLHSLSCFFSSFRSSCTDVRSVSVQNSSSSSSGRASSIFQLGNHVLHEIHEKKYRRPAPLSTFQIEHEPKISFFPFHAIQTFSPFR